MMAASAALAQERSASPPDASYMFRIAPDAAGLGPLEPLAFSPFDFDGLHVGVWAPVEPHYDVNENRDPAGESFWSVDEFRRATAFRATDAARVAISRE